MDRNHFINQMGRLMDVFPAAYKSRDRVDMIWREVSSIEDQAFTRVVDELIGSCRQPPMVNDFRDRAAIEREIAWSRRKKEPKQDTWKPNPVCHYCRDMGTYLCTHPTRGGVWAFRCHCEVGCADPRRVIPQYKQDHATEGFKYLTVEEIKYRLANTVVSEMVQA